MSTIGNLLWFFPFGLLTGIGWYIAGTVCFISVVGIPWARACFVIGSFTFAPFGREIISRKELTGKSDLGNSPLGSIGNIIWFICAGLWLAIAHVSSAVVCACTIIGIPFALQHLKLAGVSLCPIGKTVVKKHLAQAAHLANAQKTLGNIRGGRAK